LNWNKGFDACWANSRLGVDENATAAGAAAEICN